MNVVREPAELRERSFGLERALEARRKAADEGADGETLRKLDLAICIATRKMESPATDSLREMDLEYVRQYCARLRDAAGTVEDPHCVGAIRERLEHAVAMILYKEGMLDEEGLLSAIRWTPAEPGNFDPAQLVRPPSGPISEIIRNRRLSK